jgi:hypothetical protein
MTTCAIREGEIWGWVDHKRGNTLAFTIFIHRENVIDEDDGEFEPVKVYFRFIAGKYFKYGIYAQAASNICGKLTLIHSLN